jgi:tRNA threonylcarbamoyladenosine biosynthesis protein TsaB
MVRETLERWNKKSHEDVAYFEPFYLKEFVAGISKKSDKALFGRD